jgi:hypothetical protein
MLRRTLLTTGLLGAGLAPASAQWFGGLGGYAEGPLPPTAIMRSLMQRGFIEIGRPRFDGAVYVVEGVNARGMRLRLVIDAFDGGVISRTRLDAPLLPPADVGRERSARAAPLRGELEPDFDEDLAPRGRSLGQDFGRERIDRGDLPPPPGARRAERIEPPLAGAEPPRPLPPNAAARPAEPRPIVGAEPPRRREAKKPDPAGRQPATALPGKAKAVTEPQAVPPAPAAPVEAAKPAPSMPTAAAPPPVNAPAPDAQPLAPAASEKPAEAPQRTVRVIDGVAPVVPQASAAPKAAAEPKSDITPPATQE